MPFIGNTPAAVPLTSADIADGIITSAKIVDGTIVNADINASAAIVASKLTGTGKVLQVVSTTKTDTFQTSSTSFVDVTGMSVSITPSSASNKIFIITTFSMGQSDSSGLAVYNLVRGATNIAQPSTTPTFNGTSGALDRSAGDNVMPVSFSFLDSPSTTSSTTYKIQTRINTGTLSFNRRNTADSAFTATITAFEIGV